MILHLITPNKWFQITRVDKLVVEGLEGSFGILPKHSDYLAKVVPSILLYQQEGQEKYIAIDEGILVKREDFIYLSVKEALQKEDLGELKKEMEKEMEGEKEIAKKSREEILQMELNFIKRFYSLRKPG